MIETKEQVISSFREKYKVFLEDPSLMPGLELDDATVTLKRYVLTELRDEALGRLLAQFPKLIRQMDVDALRAQIREVEGALVRHESLDPPGGTESQTA